MTSLSLDSFETRYAEVTLCALDGTCCKINEKCAALSVVLHTMFAEVDVDVNLELPVAIKEGIFLEQIVNFLIIQNGKVPPDIEKPLRSNNLSEVTLRGNAEFIDEIHSTYGNTHLYQLLNYANYLDIKSLLELGSAKIASLIRNKPVDLIAEILK